MVNATDQLERGRESFAERAWLDAHESLSRADDATALSAADVELLATSAYMLGREDEWASGLERAHRAHLDDGETLLAVRCAFWLSLSLAVRGESGRASGWLSRAQRLLASVDSDCVERGYLLVPVAAGHEHAADYEAAQSVAAEAAEIGARFGDADLVAVAMHAQGNALVKQGRVNAGFALLDEAMVAVTTGELSPIATGLVYCSVIDGCYTSFELGRAQEWTMALTRWCERQPEMVAFTGKCLVHRAAIMQLHGAWPGALTEALRAGERCERSMNELAMGEALYQQGEIHRLQGQLADAEEVYRKASRSGFEPQPGFALLRLAQGKPDKAVASIRRALSETSEPLKRAALLPAYVEITLSAGSREEAKQAGLELEQISKDYERPMLAAMAAQARGSVDIESDPAGALLALRRARELWQQLQAPYEAARTRVLIGLACRALEDEDTAAMELESARRAFEELGAVVEHARVESLAESSTPADALGLTPRELEVLRLVAAGDTNKAVAAELVLSERTVDRHVSNIFAKLGVSSRAAATARAHVQGLV